MIHELVIKVIVSEATCAICGKEKDTSLKPRMALITNSGLLTIKEDGKVEAARVAFDQSGWESVWLGSDKGSVVICAECAAPKHAFEKMQRLERDTFERDFAVSVKEKCKSSQ